MTRIIDFMVENNFFAALCFASSKKKLFVFADELDFKNFFSSIFTVVLFTLYASNFHKINTTMAISIH